MGDLRWMRDRVVPRSATFRTPVAAELDRCFFPSSALSAAGAFEVSADMFGLVVERMGGRIGS